MSDAKSIDDGLDKGMPPPSTPKRGCTKNVSVPLLYTLIGIVLVVVLAFFNNICVLFSLVERSCGRCF